MSSDEPRKIAAFFPVSQELVDSFMRPSIIERLMRPDDRTDEQRAADRAERAAKLAAERATIHRRHAQLMAAANPILRAILDLHGPVVSEYGSHAAQCEGCDSEGYEHEPPEFPCRTYALVADVFRPVGGTQ